MKLFSELRPAVPGEVSMREIERIQQQPIPTHRPAYSPTVPYQPEFDFRFRLWQSLFAFGVFESEFSEITRLSHFLIHGNEGKTLTVVSSAF
jgi:hypothetical protein